MSSLQNFLSLRFGKFINVHICNNIKDEVKSDVTDIYLTIIPRARFGYESIDSQRGV